MKFRNSFIVTIMSLSLLSCQNVSSPSGPDQLNVQNLGQIGSKVQSAELPITHNENDSNQASSNFYVLSFDFSSSKSVTFYESAYFASDNFCTTSVALSDDDVSYVQTKLSTVPICEFSIIRHSEMVACTMSIRYWPTSIPPFLSTAKDKFDFGLNSVCDGGQNPWKSNCDNLVTNEVAQYLAKKIDSSSQVTCSSHL